MSSRFCMGHEPQATSATKRTIKVGIHIEYFPHPSFSNKFEVEKFMFLVAQSYFSRGSVSVLTKY